MKYRILIVGAGQLGSRYLQGLSKVSTPLDIWVYDVSESSLAIAETRWQEMGGENNLHSVNYLADSSTFPSKIDLAIISTSADVRANVVGELAKQISVRYWVLEKVLAQSDSDILKIQEAIGQDSLAWVNTPMHMWSLYKNIRAIYSEPRPVFASFEGLSALACNAIHYIDFVARWNNSTPVFFDTSGLQKQWVSARRIGFFEVFGELVVGFDDGSKLRLMSSNTDKLEYRVDINIAQDQWRVFQAEGYAESNNGHIVHGACEYQSQLTAPLVESILNNKSCDLPDLTESAKQHGAMLAAFCGHWNSCMPNKIDDRLPIT